jgi:hypothetical protein
MTRARRDDYRIDGTDKLEFHHPLIKFKEPMRDYGLCNPIPVKFAAPLTELDFAHRAHGDPARRVNGLTARPRRLTCGLANRALEVPAPWSRQRLGARRSACDYDFARRRRERERSGLSRRM